MVSTPGYCPARIGALRCKGFFGQAIFVDPELKVVIVHTAVGKDASGDASGNHLSAERDALFCGVVAQYGAW